MFVAGEASGDLLAAELVRALKSSSAIRAMPFPPRFFGAGGPRLAAEGVELDIDMTRHAVIGLSDVLKKIHEFKRILDQLVQRAIERQPDVIVCVDFSGFNRRFAHAVRRKTRRGPFNNWNPKIVQYVSPQVWASRPGRARSMARDLDLLLTIFPFEKDWYAQRVPELPVEFVGHPIVERYANTQRGTPNLIVSPGIPASHSEPKIVLLPGSRVGELKRHLPPMLQAARLIQQKMSARFRLVLPNEQLAEQVRRQLAAANLPALNEANRRQIAAISACLTEADIQVGHLGDALAEADLAIASTGTVTMECALFGVPTVAIYKTSWTTYLIARNIITVRHLAMPNLLADEEVFPEFVQYRATAENIAGAAIGLLDAVETRRRVKARLATVIGSLGGTGASERAAGAILKLISGPDVPG
jgi:lipid-A-disaccharide synthase